jgi:RHS repeat-associated protein
VEKKSGVSEGNSSLPHGSGAVRTIGATFQPNLALGGGTYRIPIDLPAGPGAFSPKLELLYDTSIGNGIFGLGWAHSIPYIEQRRQNVYTPAGEPEYSVGGAETLVARGDGSFVPFIQQALQTFHFDGTQWISRTPSLVELRFGSTDASRISGNVNGTPRVHRWLLDRITFPGGRIVEVDYDADGAQRHLRRLRWSVFRVELVSEPRPDAFSQFDAGFELRVDRRCRRIELHNERVTPTLVRTIDLTYAEAPYTGVSLLTNVDVVGQREIDGAPSEARLSRLTLGYTQFDPGSRRIEKFTSMSIPPPPLDEATTLLDLRGTALPGILRLDGRQAMYWPNLGNHRWGAPQPLRNVPPAALSDEGVRFADITGSGTVDLVIADANGTGYYPNDPEHGFLPRRTLTSAPTFTVADPDTRLLDLDGDGRADLLSLRNRHPIAFFRRDDGWRDPLSLPRSAVPDVDFTDPRLRFADMNGDGSADLVLLMSRRIVWWPSLGDGRWGDARVMDATPAFDVPRPEQDVYLADVNGDGLADLVLVGAGSVRVCINRVGEGFSEPIVLERTPMLSNGNFLIADMSGSGTSGLLWTNDATGAAHGYWYLDLLNGVKPQLLASIDNGAGMVTTLEYSTSTRERVRDLDAGVAWSGYLPFTVAVVKRLVHTDTVRNRTRTVVYDYRDGHFDGRAREYLGFAQVDATQSVADEVAPVTHRYSFHTRGTSARDLAFIAGKGQPHRTELVDPATGAVAQIEESTWTAFPVTTVSPDQPAYLAAESVRTMQRVDAGVVYHRQRVEYDLDSAGNRRRERHRAEWLDLDGAMRVDRYSLDTIYATHDTFGVTNLPSRVRRLDGEGRLLKEFRCFYDGPAFEGLPLGQVVNGFRSRQTEVALTSREIDAAYGGTPPLLDALYRAEDDPDFGRVWVKDVGRVRLDAFGNQLETFDASGHHIIVEYDTDSLHPVAITESDVPRRELAFDPIAQQVSRIVDRNGNVERFRYDALGNVLEVDRRGALPGMPTETFEYRRDVVPNRITQRVRVHHHDPEPGHVKIEYRDGAGNVVQVKILDSPGRWAVGKQRILAVGEVLLGERDAYFSATEAFEAEPPPGVAETRMTRDFANRVVEQVLFNGTRTFHRYEANAVHFYGPGADPKGQPTRSSWNDANDNLVAIAEYDQSRRYAERREYDALNRLTRIIDCEGHTALAYAYDLWGNRLRVESAEAGAMTFVYDPGNHEVLRTDAEGRVLFRRCDRRGRTLELRRNDAQGPIEETFTWDEGPGANVSGRVARVVSASGTVEYSYSTEGDPVEIRRTIDSAPAPYTTRFTYNAQRKITSVEYPDGTSIRYEYTPHGMLARIPGVIDSIEYGPTGKRTRIVYANGLESRRGYTPGDSLVEELSTEVAATGVRYQHLVYELAPNGVALRVDDRSNVAGKARHNQTFTYDTRLRLVGATSSLGDGLTFEYRYDAMGNMVFSSESFGEEMDYGLQLALPQPNRLVKRRAAAAPEFTYDAAGLLTHDPEMGDLTYDFRSRLVRVDRRDGSRVEMAYDHNDRRVKTTITAADGTATTRFEVEGIFLDGAERAAVVFDEDKRLAILPADGDALLHHLDRLGNVNVISNLATGAFVGHDEYTPYGRLLVSITIAPAFHFLAVPFTPGIEAALLGARYYSPRLGRFLTPDLYLALAPDKLPPLLSATNLYLYGYSNPANFTDPTGRLAPLVAAVIIAGVVGSLVGAIGAAVNGVRTVDEWIMWMLGGLIGGVLSVLTFGGAAHFIFGASAAGVATAAWVGLAIWGTASLLSSVFGRMLDESNSPVSWVFSWLLKFVQSPVFSIVAFLVGVIAWVSDGGHLDFRRGAIFIEKPDSRAITLGSVVWAGKGYWNARGNVKDDRALHEAFHTRQVGTIGEFGFYLTYLTVGGLWALAQDGKYFGVDARGCGNPFEKTAHSIYSGSLGDPHTVTHPSDC